MHEEAAAAAAVTVGATFGAGPRILLISVAKAEDALRVDQEKLRQKSSLRALQAYIQELERTEAHHG